MTLLFALTMGCGQSIRKKSKHKVESHTDENTYDNQSYGTAPSTGTVLSKPSITVPSIRSTDAEDGGTVTTNKPLKSTNIVLNHNKRAEGGAAVPAQTNGDVNRLGPHMDTTDQEEEKIRRDSGTNHGLQAQSKMSASQLEFFRILDEKIEKGEDYCASNGDTT